MFVFRENSPENPVDSLLFIEYSSRIEHTAGMCCYLCMSPTSLGMLINLLILVKIIFGIGLLRADLNLPIHFSL